MGFIRSSSPRLGRLFACILGFAILPGSGSTDPGEEAATGRALDQAILSREILIVDPQASRRVREIGAALVRHAGSPAYAFEFRILNQPQVNAFATAGGYIYLQSGLLDFCENQDELAGVIAHEIVHISRSHLTLYREHLRRKAISGEIMKFLILMALQTGGAAAGTYTGVPNAAEDFARLGGQLAGAIGATLIDPATKASIFGYGRDEELEADRTAIEIMRAAGFDPNGFVQFLERLQKLRDQQLADHQPLATALINAEPGLEERVRLLRTMLSDPRP